MKECSASQYINLLYLCFCFLSASTFIFHFIQIGRCNSIVQTEQNTVLLHKIETAVQHSEWETHDHNELHSNTTTHPQINMALKNNTCTYILLKTDFSVLKNNNGLI